MAFALCVRWLLGGGPPHEVIHLNQPELAETRRAAPPGGWRCGACGAPATHLSTWPPTHAGFYCTDHCVIDRGQPHNPHYPITH